MDEYWPCHGPAPPNITLPPSQPTRYVNAIDLNIYIFCHFIYIILLSLSSSNHSCISQDLIFLLRCHKNTLQQVHTRTPEDTFVFKDDPHVSLVHDCSLYTVYMLPNLAKLGG